MNNNQQHFIIIPRKLKELKKKNKNKIIFILKLYLINLIIYTEYDTLLFCKHASSLTIIFETDYIAIDDIDRFCRYITFKVG